MSQVKSPLFSIITVVYNGASILANTMQSITSQSFQDYEYIIQDGASKDATLQIAQSNANDKTKIYSEADTGLYDAMNKAIDKASGKYLVFINAGDKLFSTQTLATIASQADDADILYGDTMMIDAAGNELGLLSKNTHNNAPEKLSWHSMQRGMVVCHQSFYIKKSIIPYYNLNYKLSADIDWMIRCLKLTDSVKKIDAVLSNFEMGGLSKKRFKQAMKERFWIFNNHYGLIKNLYNHIFMLSRFWSSNKNKK